MENKLVATAKLLAWYVVDTHRDSLVINGPYLSYSNANRYAQRRNQRYGAVRYTPVYKVVEEAR